MKKVCCIHNRMQNTFLFSRKWLNNHTILHAIVIDFTRFVNSADDVGILLVYSHYTRWQ